MTVKTPAQLKADVASDFPDNTTGLITPAIMRTFQDDFIDSWGAPITSGQLDLSMSPTWTGPHTFNNSSTTITITIPSFSGTWLSQNLFNSTYASTHAESRATLAIQRTASGSGVNSSAAADLGAFITSGKTNWQTSTTEGEIDGVYCITAQGLKGDSSAIEANASKVYGTGGGATGGVSAAQVSARWVDSSERILMNLATVLSYGEGQGSTSGHTGFGILTENQGAAAAVAASQIIPFAGLYIGVFDTNGTAPTNAPYFTNAIVAAGSRGTADQYFKVVSGLNQAGDIIVGSGSANGTDGNPTQSGGTRWTIKNVSGEWRLYANDGSTVATTISQTGRITTNDVIRCSNNFATTEFVQLNGTGYRWVLNNDAKLYLQYTADTFSNVATLITLDNLGQNTGFSGSISATGAITSSSPSAKIGYATGAGSTVAQGTNRTTAVNINAVSGAITLFSAAGSTTPATFTVNNTSVAATDTIIANQKSGTDLYHVLITAVATNSFNITFYTTGGTTTETPVFNFNVIKGVSA